MSFGLRRCARSSQSQTECPLFGGLTLVVVWGQQVMGSGSGSVCMGDDSPLTMQGAGAGGVLCAGQQRVRSLGCTFVCKAHGRVRRLAFQPTALWSM